VFIALYLALVGYSEIDDPRFGILLPGTAFKSFSYWWNQSVRIARLFIPFSLMFRWYINRRSRLVLVLKVVRVSLTSFLFYFVITVYASRMFTGPLFFPTHSAFLAYVISEGWCERAVNFILGVVLVTIARGLFLVVRQFMYLTSTYVKGAAAAFCLWAVGILSILELVFRIK
jgi:hypothetical protein